MHGGPRSLRSQPHVKFRDLSVRSAFTRAKKLEQRYASRLRAVAREIDNVVRGFIPRLPDDDKPHDYGPLEQHLRRYAATLRPWAESVANKMIAEVAARDDRSWAQAARQMGRALRREIETAPIGRVVQQRLADQVQLITSLPVESAERVRKLATEARVQGTRAEALAVKILQTGEVSKSRANMIARTETARTATELTKARAEHVGSTHFVWRTAGDAGVRKSHKQLNGTVHRWDAPPVCDAPDVRALPGAIWNCRCVAIPILPGDDNFKVD